MTSEAGKKILFIKWKAILWLNTSDCLFWVMQLCPCISGVKVMDSKNFSIVTKFLYWFMAAIVSGIYISFLETLLALFKNNF